MEPLTPRDEERLKSLIWRKIQSDGIPVFYDFAKNAITEFLVRKVKQGKSLFEISQELKYSVPTISLAIAGKVSVKRGRKIDPKNWKSEKKKKKRKDS